MTRLPNQLRISCWGQLTFWVSLFISGVILGGEIEGTVRFPAGVDGRVSPAVVYVATKGVTGPAGVDTAVVDQQDLRFLPRVTALALGGTIVFRNSELREAHNVKATAQNDCCSFNQMVGPGGQFEVSPQRAGVVRLLCNVHQHMRGFVVVCPSSMFAITDAEGRFTIENVPDGTHKIVVWQELSKPFTSQLEVSGHSQLDVELERSPSAQLPAPLVRTQPALAWSDVVRHIAQTLDEAIRAAQQPGGAVKAQRLEIGRAHV